MLAKKIASGDLFSFFSSDSATPNMGESGATVKTSAEVTNHGKAAASVYIQATLIDSTGNKVADAAVSSTVVVQSGHTTVANATQALADVKLWPVLLSDAYLMHI